MSYVVKFGTYYLREFEVRDIFSMDIKLVLSKEVMRGYKKEIAYEITSKYGGKVIEIPDEVTNEEMEGQLSLFDKEVKNEI